VTHMTELRTAAARELLAFIDRQAPSDANDHEEWVAEWYAWRNEIAHQIIAIEHESGSLGSQHGFREGAAQVAVERPSIEDDWYERDSGSATPDPLPPCPICGKDDLFVGTDGKPGCPHCEVAVVLPRERPRAEPFDEAQAWADMAARRGDPELGTPAAEHGEWPGESRPINKARERQILGIGEPPAPALDPWTTLRMILREAEAEGSWQFVRARCHEALARLRSPESDR
jgi:hypothetical protein